MPMTNLRRRTSYEELAWDAPKMEWVIEISWLPQELFGLKPEWVLLKRLFSIIKWKIVSNTSFFKNFGTDIEQRYKW